MNPYLVWLRMNLRNKKPGCVLRYRNYAMRINDVENFYFLFKDIFMKGIYRFEAKCPAPFILDCGSNIGMSILYFKHIYPKARIIGFEPDPAVFNYLTENVTRNKLQDVKLVQAALANKDGVSNFYSDGKNSSHLAGHDFLGLPQGWQNYEVPCVRLRSYLTEPVDFLKMNIEGSEWEVLLDSADCLRQVQEMIIEYHHVPSFPRTLHKILELLYSQGFEYLINDFDSESNQGVIPPFKLTKESYYYLLIYAKRKD